jgi:hypothetical protein
MDAIWERVVIHDDSTKEGNPESRLLLIALFVFV